MKRYSLIVILLLCIVSVMPADAKIRFGIKVGANVTKQNTEIEKFELDNTALVNFTGGVTLDWNITAGFGFDVSALYTAKGTEYVVGTNVLDGLLDNLSGTTVKNTIHYIEVPVNLKYKLEIPAIKDVFAPYVFAGPSFAFKVGETIKYAEDKKGHISIDNKSIDYALNVGLGMEFIKHLNIAVQYGWGLGTAAELDFSALDATIASSTAGVWTVTVGWIF